MTIQSKGKVGSAVTLYEERLTLPSQAWRDAALRHDGGPESHDRLVRESRLFDRLRVQQPPRGTAIPTSVPRRLRVAAWNLERCKHVEESAALLAREAADIALVTEMDLGMARSGNRDTTTDLAAALDMGHAWGVEFIELGHGNVREQAEHGDTPNTAGLHGNGLVTRFAVDRAALLPLDPGGFWFSASDNTGQRRVGGRMAIAVRHLFPEPIWFVVVHYESRLGPADRALETEILLSRLDALCASEPVLIGGDFNCRGMYDAGFSDTEVLARPQEAEPMFARLNSAGFEWQSCNLPLPTTRNHPWDSRQRPLQKIDWFFVRGLSCSAPALVPAVGAEKQTLSDHEAIFVDVTL